MYNEESVIDESYMRLKAVMDSVGGHYEIIFVNDGSRDKTREKAEAICKRDKKIRLLNFSRNFGHQAAITAGMDMSLGDAVIVIDADLQDPPEIISDMIEKWKEGYDVVYGKRSRREGESFLKKITAGAFYRLLKRLASVDVPVDTGDFRLIDRKVCDALMSLPERNRYVRGLVSWVGYRQTSVEFVRKERFAGETKYPLMKMLKLAFDGITSLSCKPLVLSAYLGGTTLAAGAISSVLILIRNIVNNSKILDLDLLMSVNLILFGLIFCSLGILGQYIGRNFEESKGRPVYIIESQISSGDKKEKGGYQK